jgi:hypothetical protein
LTQTSSETLERVAVRQDGTYVEVAVEVTKNLGNFENVKVRTTLGRPLNEGENPRQAFPKLYDVVTDELSETLDKALEELGYNKSS